MKNRARGGKCACKKCPKEHRVTAKVRAEFIASEKAHREALGRNIRAFDVIEEIVGKEHVLSFTDRLVKDLPW